MNKPLLFTLNSNDTCVSCLFLSLRLSTARSNPLQSASSHGKINQSSWPNQTNKSKKKYETIIVMHKRVQMKPKYYSWIDLIINSQFIGSQQTHRKKSLHRIDIQDHRGEHCIEDQIERRSHLATNWTHRSVVNYSRIIRRVARMM